MGERSSGVRKVAGALYTEHVLPDEMLALWNNGCNRRLCLVLPANQDPDAERPRVVLMFVKWLAKHLLHVDSSPTLSRFFTFRDCADRMLTMVLLGVPSHAFRLRKVKPPSPVLRGSFGKRRLR